MKYSWTYIFCCLYSLSNIFAQNESEATKYIKLGKSNSNTENESSKSQFIKIGNVKSNDLFAADWKSPSASVVTSTQKEFEFEIKIFSSEPIEENNIQVFLNKQQVTSRAGTASLLSATNEQTYKRSVNLQTGCNFLYATVNNGKEILQLQKITIYYNAEAISPPTQLPVASGKKPVIYWINPDPTDLLGKPISHKEQLLKCKFSIINVDAISTSNVSYELNNRTIAPTTDLKITKEGSKIFIEDIIKLDRDIEINKIKATIELQDQDIHSETLQVVLNSNKPNLHIISIGPTTNLQYSAKDANDFADIYSNQSDKSGNRLFKKVFVDKLIDKSATANDIKVRIEKLSSQYKTGIITENDVIILFLSSHGFILDEDFRLQANDYDVSAKRSTSVSYQKDICAVLSEIPCKKIIFVDACHSGGARANPDDILFELEKINARAAGTSVIVSSTKDQESYEDEYWENGAFTEFILEGLSTGLADNDRNKIITLKELFNHIKIKVPASVYEVKSMYQNPVMLNDELGDLGIFVLD